jgi:UDP-glucuronate 4-epimerase
MTILVTGAAGFIGAAVCKRLLDRNERVEGVDNLNAYYDPALKEARIAQLERRRGFTLHRMDIADHEALAALVAELKPSLVVHLAAQAGVRYSLDNPFAYERSNLAGHLSVLEACRHAGREVQLVYASSSSVYGERPIDGPFREDDVLGTPASLYAATKRSAELMSATYSELYGLAQTGLRFFTVYGPWGRPDMAVYAFTRKILAGEPIQVFGQGDMARDFTFIDDIVDGVMGVIAAPAEAGQHRLYNIGDSRPIGLMTMIETLERALGRKAEKLFLPKQPGDVGATYADISRLKALTGYSPQVTLEEGIPRFVDWYLAYHQG